MRLIPENISIFLRSACQQKGLKSRAVDLRRPIRLTFIQLQNQLDRQAISSKPAIYSVCDFFMFLYIAQAQLLPGQGIEGSLVYNQYYYFRITVKQQKKGVKIQVGPLSISIVLNLRAVMIHLQSTSLCSSRSQLWTQ
jgi:hypothetical protein